jgi:hypothetical protein
MKPEPNSEQPLSSFGRTQAGQPDEVVLSKIASAIRGVRYGAIEIVIQDSRVVQIERKEKFRFDKPNRF